MFGLDFSHLIVGLAALSAGSMIGMVVFALLSTAKQADGADGAEFPNKEISSFGCIDVGSFTLKNYDDQRLIIMDHETGNGGAVKKEDLVPLLNHFCEENF